MYSLGGAFVRDMLVLFQSSICRALFPRVLRSLFACIAAFKEYSILFEDHADGVYCVVRSWDENEWQEICVRVQSLGQQVPRAELSSLSRVIYCVITSQLPLSVHGGSPSHLCVLNDNRVAGRQFVVCKEYTVDLFLQCYRKVHQHIFDMLEVTTMVDFLMLRWRGPPSRALDGGCCPSTSVRRCCESGFLRIARC